MSIKTNCQLGITLIEQIVFIIIMSVGVIGLVSVIGPMVQHSADPMQTKQFAAIAESVLSEVIHQPYTWCDPDDANAATAQKYADCANPQNVMGAVPNSERRDGTGGTFFDNVSDYDGFVMNNISDPSGTVVFAGFRAEVAVRQIGATFGIANDAALAVTVTVCRVDAANFCAGRDSYALTGYRFRYAPRT